MRLVPRSQPKGSGAAITHVLTVTCVVAHLLKENIVNWDYLRAYMLTQSDFTWVFVMSA